jgi:oxygen-independent coproporphyrinogen-3 oxidase
MDWIGFGSGATSLLNQEFLATRRGQLHHYISCPSEFDDVLPAASPQITPRLIYQSLSTWEGAEARFWSERTGVPLTEVLKQPEVQYLLDQLAQAADVIKDDTSVRLNPDQAAEAFIRLLYLNAPQNARIVQSAETLLGAY